MGHKKQIINIINKLAGSKSSVQVFSDWVKCTALSISQSVYFSPTCFECAERKYKKAKEYYEKNKEKILEQTRQRSKMIYVDRKQKGICVKCGKRQSIKEKTLCLDCYSKKKKKKDPRWNNEFPRSMRPELGLCYVCSKPLNKHKSFCDECLEMGREKMRKLNSNPTEGMIAQRERWKKRQ